VQTLINLLTGLLTDQVIDKDSQPAVYETYFVFCCIWAFGGALFQARFLSFSVSRPSC
jgi:dynein heavy chain